MFVASAMARSNRTARAAPPAPITIATADMNQVRRSTVKSRRAEGLDLTERSLREKHAHEPVRAAGPGPTLEPFRSIRARDRQSACEELDGPCASHGGWRDACRPRRWFFRSGLRAPGDQPTPPCCCA